MIAFEFDAIVTMDEEDVDVLVVAGYEPGPPEEIELLSVSRSIDDRDVLGELPEYEVRTLEDQALERGPGAVEAEEMMAADAHFERERDRMIGDAKQ